MSCRITTYDVAQLAGVSQSTASRILRGSNRHSQETIRRVKEAADKLGYHPDPLLSSLVVHKQMKRKKNASSGIETIALLNLSSDINCYGHLLPFVQIDQAIRDETACLGYKLRTEQVTEKMNLPKLMNRLFKCGVRGILFHFSPFSQKNYNSIDFNRFCWVEISHFVNPVRFHSVSPDHVAAMSMIWEKLVSLGYRRIGLAMGPKTNTSSGNLWYASYLNCQKLYSLHGLADELSICLSGNEMIDGSTKTFLEWYNRERPEVIISRKSMRNMLHHCGLRIPEDVGYVNLGVNEIGAETSGIYQNLSYVGRNAVRLLHECLAKNELGIPDSPRLIITPPLWNDGRTICSKSITKK